MPLVRISHVDGKAGSFSSALSQSVHRAMIETFNVPEDDYFQIVTGHAAEQGLVGLSALLDIQHTSDMVFIQITCAKGRTIEQKKALYPAIVDNLAKDPGVRGEDVIVNLLKTKLEDWSFGNGIAQFA